MNKIKYLLLLLFVPFLVNAQVKDVEIKSIELVDKSDEVVELEETSFKELKLNFKLKFFTKDQFARYQLVLKNNGENDYEIDNSTAYNDGDFIRYEYLVNGTDKILKANSEMSINIIITYYKDLDISKFKNGKYIEESVISLELPNKEEVIDRPVMKFVNNPNTSNSDIIMIVVVLGIMSILLALFVKSKKGKVFIIMMMLLIPITAYALDKIKIEVETYIEIEEPKNTKKFSIAERLEDGSFSEPVIYEFEEGMTLEDWVNSSYNVDEYEFSYNIDICEYNKRYIFDDISKTDNHHNKSLANDHLIVENNIYYNGIGEFGVLCK